MAGRHHNFRQGDRSELLADYLLSGIGISTPIRRQDDTGFDFYCSISDQEKGILTFGYPYIIQIKSKAINNSIVYGTVHGDKWRSQQVEWLYRNELPLLFGIVDKRNQSIEIYDSTSLLFTKVTPGLPAIVEFIPRIDRSNKNEIGEPAVQELQNWTNVNSNGKSYKIDLGHPIITLTNSDFDNPADIKLKKSLLRHAIKIQSSSLRFLKQRLPYLNRIANNITDQSITEGWAFYTINNSGTEFIVNSSFEALLSIGIHSIIDKRPEITESIRQILKLITKDKIEPRFLKEYPQLFI